jgi:hypothetical protein
MVWLPRTELPEIVKFRTPLVSIPLSRLLSNVNPRTVTFDAAIWIIPPRHDDPTVGVIDAPGWPITLTDPVPIRS